MNYRGIPAGYEDEDETDSIAGMAQKITIVPDITIAAGLNGEDFDRTLTVDVDNWFERFKDSWNSYNRTPGAYQGLKVMFMNHSDPLLLALKLFANCPGCNNLKNKNLALYILETICDLYKRQPEIAANCDDNTRMIAFNFVKTCGIVPLYKAVMTTYELHKIRDLLVPKIRELIAQGHFKDAVYWTMYLEVTHLFGIYDIVFPLILQDKVFLAEEYLSVAKELILPTVQFLDSLLDKQKTVMEQCDEILTQYKYKDVKHNILSYRPMSKLVTRLAKKYKIEPHHTPNLNFTKASSYIHFLWRKYRDGGMSCDAWRELVRDAANSKLLQMDLITTIAAYGDVDEAVYWVQYYNVPLLECPDSVRSRMQKKPRSSTRKTDSRVDESAQPLNLSNSGAIAKTNRSNPDNTQKYLTLNLPIDCVILVDVKEKFIEMLTYLERQLLIAFDSEWKPSVCNENVISLLQLATMQRVYLLDCLSPQLGDDLWQQLGQRIFNNLEILKIGFSLHQDLRMLHKSLPLQMNLQSKTCYLDLRELWRRLKYLQIMKFPFGNGLNSGESLCALTELCLGKKLDKSNQCSNWANRPLRHDQIVYAALDAHCLLQVYQVFHEILLRMGLDIDQVIDEITTAKTGYLFRMKRVVSEQYSDTANSTGRSTKGIQNVQTAPPESDSHRFMCDRMLYGLSKELRKLGIDCVEIVKQGFNHCLDMARRENRFVLTRDTRYTLFANELPQGQCIQIPTDSSVDQVLNVIRLLDMKICESNLFTRCLLCNNNEFILAYKHEMQLMLYGQAQDYCDNESSAMSLTNPYERNFQLLNVNDHIINTRTTYRGRQIKIDRIKPHILHSKEHFFICDNCGVCTWDGAHSIHFSIMDEIVNRSTQQMNERQMKSSQ